MEVVLLLIRLFLTVVFAVAGVGKLLDLDGSEKAVRDFGVNEELAKPLAIFLPAAELLVALALLPISTAWFGAVGATLLLAIFVGAMLWQMAKGNAPDCHCFGAIHSEPVSWKSLIRNGVFAALAIFLVARGARAQGASLTDLKNEMALQLFFGLAIVGLLGAVIFYLRKISEQQAQIMRRIEILELVSTDDGREVKREAAGDPHDSLPIGALVPDFELPDSAGKVTTFEHLMARAKPLLFFFVSPTCNPCAALLPEIEAWQAELKDQVEFIFISSGTAAANLGKFGAKHAKNILLQNDKEVASLFYAKWTPTALFINSDGLVASHLAVGDNGIRELVAKIKTIDFQEETVFVANGTKVKIGEPMPEFAMTDVFGKKISSADYRGKKTLVAFWSTTCPHCKNMAGELQNWDRRKGADAPALLVFSDGEIEAHREIGLRSPILIDEGYKTAEKFGMHGTPSAVLINENGRIVSETAIGAANIWALVGKRK